MDLDGYQKEISLAAARKAYGRPLVAATLAHLRAEDWPEGNPIAVHFFDRMKRAIEAYSAADAEDEPIRQAQREALLATISGELQ